MKIQKTLNKLENTFEDIIDDLKKPISEIIEVLKRHKKLIVIGVVGYLIYRYLFETDTEEE